MPVATSDHTAFGKHVDNRGHEKPPVAALVAVVEETVFPPGFFVLEQCRSVALGPFVPARQLPDAESEEPKDGSEYR